MTGDERSRRPARPAPIPLPRSAAPAPAPERIRPPRLTPGAHQKPPPTRAGGPRSAAGAAAAAGAALFGAGRVAGGAGRYGSGAMVEAGPVPVPVPAILDRAAADRQLIVGAVAVMVLIRVFDGPAAWLVAAALAVGVLIGAGWSRVTAEADSDAGGRVPTFRARWEAVVGGATGIESGIVPGVLAASLALALRLVPLDWRLVVALVVAYVLLDRTIALERALGQSANHEHERWKVVLVLLVTAFIGFAGVASMVNGGIAGVGAPALAERDLVLLAGIDALVAILLGFRLARLGPASRREAVLSGVGFGAVVALGGGLLRAMAIPQLVGPALLTLIVYLWDALNATTPSIRRDPRWRWQVAMLVLLSVVVVGWNLRLRV